jgi:hypothetical protein
MTGLGALTGLAAEKEEYDQEGSRKHRRRSGQQKREFWAAAGHMGGKPPDVPGVGDASDPFLAVILEQVRVRDAALAEQAQAASNAAEERQRQRDAALAEQQQQNTAALVAALASKEQRQQPGGRAAALLAEMRTIQELLSIGAIDDEMATALRDRARADALS